MLWVNSRNKVKKLKSDIIDFKTKNAVLMDININIRKQLLKIPAPIIIKEDLGQTSKEE